MGLRGEAKGAPRRSSGLIRLAWPCSWWLGVQDPRGPRGRRAPLRAPLRGAPAHHVPGLAQDRGYQVRCSCIPRSSSDVPACAPREQQEAVVIVLHKTPL